MDSKAVSPLIGFVLLLAIIMGFIGIVQSTWVPEWNKAVEAEHLSKLESEISEIPKIMFLSATTGKQGAASIDAGCEYPNRVVLINPPPASTALTAVPLSVEVEFNETLPNGKIFHYNKTFSTHAILLQPSYFYLQRPKMIVEHSAIIKSEVGSVIEIASPISFARNKIHLFIVNTTFNSFSSSRDISLQFDPISYGGRVFVKNATITVEVLDETFNWWNDTLANIFGADNVTSDGNGNITITLNNATLSMSYLVVHASSGGSVEVSESVEPYRIVGLQPYENEVNLTTGMVEKFGVKILDKYMNPVRNAKVIAEVSGGIGKIRGSDRVEVNSDTNGEVWVYLNTSRDISVNCILGSVSFYVSGVEPARYNVTLCKPSIDFALEFPLAVVYNARTNGTFAFGDQVDRLPPKNNDVPADRPLNASKIGAEDEVYEISQAETRGNYAAQRFEFHVNIDNAISEFCVNWNGHGLLDLGGLAFYDSVSMYIWNFREKSYDVIAKNVESPDDIWLGRCYYNSEISEYVSSDGKIIILVGTSTSTYKKWGLMFYSVLKTDYIQLLVVYK